MVFNLQEFNRNLNNLRGDRFSYYFTPPYTHNFENPDKKILTLSIPNLTHLDINNIDLKNEINKKFGTEIISLLLETARVGGIQSVRAISINDASRALFEKFGFDEEEGSDDMTLYL